MSGILRGNTAFPEQHAGGLAHDSTSLLAYFAAHAPMPIPEWFQVPSKFPEPPLTNRAAHGDWKDAVDMERYFAWRIEYAEVMVGRVESFVTGPNRSHA